MPRILLNLCLLLWATTFCSLSYATQSVFVQQIQIQQPTLIKVSGPALPYQIQVAENGIHQYTHKSTADHYPVEWLYFPDNTPKTYTVSLILAPEDRIYSADFIRFDETKYEPSTLHVVNQVQASLSSSGPLDNKVHQLSALSDPNPWSDITIAHLLHYQGKSAQSNTLLTGMPNKGLSAFSPLLKLQKLKLQSSNYIQLKEYHLALNTMRRYLKLWQEINQTSPLTPLGLAEAQLSVSYILAHIDIDDQAFADYQNELSCHNDERPKDHNLSLAQQSSNCLLNRIAEQFDLTQSPDLAFSFYKNSWLYYNSVNDHSQTQTIAEQALSGFQNRWRGSQNATFHQFLGHSFYRNGELSKGLDEYRKSLEGFLSAEGQQESFYTAYQLQTDTADSYFNIAFLYNKIGEYKRSISYFERSAQLREQIGNRSASLVAQSYKASALRALGEAELASKVHKAVVEQLSHENYYFLTTSIELATDYIDLKNWTEALKVVQSLKNINKVYTPQRIDISLIEMQVAFARQDFKELKSQQERLNSIFQSNIQRTGQNSYLLRHLQYLDLQMQVSSSKKQLDALDQFYTQAQHLIASAKQTLRNTLAFTQATHRIIQRYVNARLKITSDTDQQALALVFDTLDNYYTQNFIAARNVHKVTQAHAQATQDSKEKQFVQQLWRQKVAAEKRAIASISSEQKKQAIDEAALLHDRLSAYSLQHQKHHSVVSQIGALALSKKLLNNEVVGLYFYSPQRSFVLFLNSKGLELVNIAHSKQLNSLLESIGKGDGLPQDATNMSLPELLPKGLHNGQVPSKLYIVADSPYDKIPFDILNVSTNKNRYRAARTEYEFVQIFSPSLYFADTTLSATVAQKIDNGIDIAIFANPIIDRSSFNKTGTESAYDKWRSGLNNLPYTQIEAQRIQALFNDSSVSVFSGENATNETLLAKRTRQATVLHIATHGYYDPQTPEIVAFATTANDQTVNQHDFITLSELHSRPFSSQLVVVSGCETLLGQDYGGTGMNGLSRNFVLQGAGSVIGTLWKVPDKPTAQFMAHFYQALKQNNGDSSKALFQAKNRLASNGRYRNPVYWAGFALMASHRSFEQLSL